MTGPRPSRGRRSARGGPDRTGGGVGMLRCSVAALLCLGLLAPPTARAQPRPPATDPLSRLRDLDRSGQSPAARTALGLDLLRAEMRSPAPFDEKNPAQPSGHDWVMARVTEKLASAAVDNRSLQAALKEEPSRGVRHFPAHRAGAQGSPFAGR